MTMAPKKIYRPQQPVEVYADQDDLIVRIADGRILRTPLSWYPWLSTASIEQIADVELDALTIYWPEFDDGIDIDWLIENAAQYHRQSAIVSVSDLRVLRMFVPAVTPEVYISVTEAGSAEVEWPNRARIVVRDYDLARA